MTKPSPVCSLTPENIAFAADALKAGDLVAFPTKTVYGLGADASNDLAVAKIFDVKGRPSINPLIVHVKDIESALRIAFFDNLAEKLALEFWPGALTLILPRRPDACISHLVSAGLPTVALRVPAHEGAQCLLKEAECPISAPSANRSGHMSPTTAQHVQEAFGDEVAIILDGGPCQIGIESSVIDLSNYEPVLLRPGGLPPEAIEKVLGRALSTSLGNIDEPRAPGILGPHYQPSTPLHLDTSISRPGEALLGFGQVKGATLNLSISGDLREAAANLFAHLHTLDAGQYTAIAVMPIPDKNLGRAINDRLRRAAVRKCQLSHQNNINEK